MNSTEAYRHLMEVRGLSGYSKQGYLSQFPELRPILNLAMNPYITFGIRDPNIPGTGSNNFKEAGIKRLLEDLASRRLTGQRAVDMTFHAQSCMTPESAKLLGLILDKNLRIGLAAKSVNKLWPGTIPVHEVMLAQKFDASRVKFPCRAEPKLDGIRATVIGNDLYTRNGLKLLGLEVIKEELKLLSPVEWDGEIEVPGCTFQKASGLLRSQKAVPDAQFTIFACRNSELVTDISDLPHIRFIKYELCSNLDDVYSAYEGYRQEGYEGAVIKPISYQYEFKRSYSWMKMKPSCDGEFKVLGVYEGEGKYAGMLGGLIVDFHGHEDRVGTGFLDGDRMRFWDLPEDIIGKTITVEYMEETDDGHMRHSRFKGIRWDK